MARKLTADQLAWLYVLEVSTDSKLQGYHLASATKRYLSVLKRRGYATYQTIPDRVLTVGWTITEAGRELLAQDRD